MQIEEDDILAALNMLAGKTPRLLIINFIREVIYDPYAPSQNVQILQGKKRTKRLSKRDEQLQEERAYIFS